MSRASSLAYRADSSLPLHQKRFCSRGLEGTLAMKTQHFYSRIPHIIALAAGLVLAGCGKNQSNTGGTSPPAASAEKNSFSEVTSRLDPGGNLYMYVGTAQWLDGLSKKMGDWRDMLQNLPNANGTDRENMTKVFDLLTTLTKDSGVEDVSGVGLSSIAMEKGLYRNKVFVHHYKGKGSGFLWTLFGKGPHKLDGVDLLPQTTALASFSDLDIAGLWSVLKKDLDESGIPQAKAGMEQFQTQFETRTGVAWDKLLNSLGGNYGLIITLDDSRKFTIPMGQNQQMELPTPGILLAIKVKDDTIFDRLDKALKDMQQPVATVDKDGLKMRTVVMQLPLPVPLRPSIARSGDYLFVASTDALVEEVLAVKSGKQAGLKGTDEFKKLAQDVPREGNNFSYVSHRLADALQTVREQALARTSAVQPGQAELIKKLFTLNQPGFAYTVSANTDEGWMMTGIGNQDGTKMVLLPAVAVPAIAAGMLLPALSKAKARAQTVACINNLQQIQLAKKLWATDHNKGDQDIPTMADLKPYLGSPVICPTGGRYRVNAVKQDATCSMPGHRLHVVAAKLN
jgi:hypothetical protein